MKEMTSVEVHSSNQSPTTNFVESQQSTQREIKNECEITWEHIQETHHRLVTRLEDRPATGAEKANAIVKVLQHKEKRLKAQLDILKSQDIEVVSKDPNFVETVLKDDVIKTTGQLQETLMIIKGQRQELAGEIEREKKMLEEQQEFQRVLQQKIQVYEDQDFGSQKSILEDLQARKKKANRHYKTLMQQLGTFLSEHFPKPAVDEINNETTSSKQSKSYCTLLDLTEVLMNRLFESPHDPYVKLLPSFWPPYVELLLRCGIIQRHPDDCNRIRLVGYHV